MRVNQVKLKAVTRKIAADLMTPGPLELPVMVGLKELVRMFGVKDNTPYQWRSKGQLPKEDGEVSNNPQWKLTTIYAWADETKRTIVWDPWDVLEADDEAA
ncbi:hypothetical protein GA0070610_1781 [Micromonospora echinofusca]|uniref:Uncharacterized protein n=1 Tax=Micromonospora echinofusca TaxID=47858 RepID=A0A1C5G767_MICEH|nr:hypothetical protein [Micromonospora echinofusca]SCG15547.1 hypothetical protein GA0070610_1781 [Micromonospora echinofusca]